MKKEALRFVNVHAADSGFGVLQDASFCLYQGETVALAGLINSGKVTLVHMLSGDILQDGGTVYVQGRQVNLNSYESARNNGIALFADERCLFSNLSLQDNLAISQKGKGLFAPMEPLQYGRDVEQLMDILDIDFSKKNVDALDTFEKVRLEILKAYIGGARIFIFSTVYLYCTEAQANRLASIIQLLNKLGCTVIIEANEYFSIFEDIVDRCIVVRSGVVSTILYRDDNEIFDEDKVRHAIVGHSFNRRYDFAEHIAPAAEAPAFLSLSAAGSPRPLQVKRGSILGLHDTSDRLPKTMDELLLALAGTYRVHIDGVLFTPKSVQDLIEHGVAVITQESASRPIFFNLSPVENVCIFAQHLFGQKFIYNRRVSEYLFDVVVHKYSALKHCIDLKTRKDCYGLSFQQQAELMIAKWLAANPRILVFYTPLAGVDTKSAERFKELHAALSLAGKTQILISSSYESLEEVCTEIYEV